MKKTNLFLMSLILASTQAFAAPVLKMTYLENGRVGFEACSQSGQCNGFGNPNGYTETDIQRMWNPNHVIAGVDGAGAVVIGVGSIFTGAFGGVVAGGDIIGGGGALLGQTAGFLVGMGIPDSLAYGISKVAKGLNPHYQWTEGSLKTDMKSALKRLKKPGDSVSFAFVSNDRHLDRDQRITTDILKKLPSDKTYPVAGQNAGRTGVAAR